MRVRVLCLGLGVCLLLLGESYLFASPASLQKRLLSACRKGSIPLVKQLLAQGVKINVSEGEFTPLMETAQAGRIKVLVFLLKRGAKVKARHAPGYLTALMYAKNYGCVKALLGANANAKDVNVDGESVLLQWAARKGEEATKVCRLLISKGADVNGTTITNETALMSAVEAGNARTVRLLLAKGAQVSRKDESGRTAFSRAVIQRRSDMATLLKKAGAKR